jgi:hypothetical protein
MLLYTAFLQLHFVALIETLSSIKKAEQLAKAEE